MDNYTLELLTYEPYMNLNFPLASCLLNIWDAPNVDLVLGWVNTRDAILRLRSDVKLPEYWR